jgi:tetratricopeptide (TPR) repeat protein
MFLFVFISAIAQAQDSQPPTARQIVEADSPVLRGQAILEGYPDLPSVSTKHLTTWERASALGEAVAPTPSIDALGPVGVLSVAALKHKVPKQARKANECGVAFGKQNEHVKATAEFKRAIALDPQFADAHNNLGSEAFLLGLLAEAAREFRRAVELNPGIATAYVNLATTELLMGNRSEAEEHVKRGIALGDWSAYAHSVLASALVNH